LTPYSGPGTASLRICSERFSRIEFKSPLEKKGDRRLLSHQPTKAQGEINRDEVTGEDEEAR